jgi:hypothetical protein
MDFVVHRETWYRGMGSGGSKLLLPDGRRCCLGFVAAQCNIPDNYLIGVGSPFYVHSAGSLNFPSNFLKPSGNTDWIMEAMRINDNPVITNERREERLIKLFKENGHTIRFEGRWP